MIFNFTFNTIVAVSFSAEGNRSTWENNTDLSQVCFVLELCSCFLLAEIGIIHLLWINSTIFFKLFSSTDVCDVTYFSNRNYKYMYKFSLDIL